MNTRLVNAKRYMSSIHIKYRHRSNMNEQQLS